MEFMYIKEYMSYILCYKKNKHDKEIENEETKVFLCYIGWWGTYLTHLLSACILPEEKKI